jgi:hypothetical protein
MLPKTKRNLKSFGETCLAFVWLMSAFCFSLYLSITCEVYPGLAVLISFGVGIVVTTLIIELFMLVGKKIHKIGEFLEYQ